MVSGVAGFFIAVVVVSVSILMLYVGYTQIRARKLGLPPPSISSYNPFQSNNLDPYASNSGGGSGGGVVGWFKNKYQNMRNSRTTSGGYETSRHADDNAWDAQAEYGYEPDFDDNRLRQNTAYNARSGAAGGSYNMNLAGASVEEESRGRSRSREPGPETSRTNPFGDEAAPSNISTTSLGPYGSGEPTGMGSYFPPQSPTTQPPKTANGSPERRSIFREAV